MKRVRFLLAIALAQIFAFGATKSGVIKGLVVDELGNPVSGARVTTGADLDSKDVEVQLYQPPVFETDANGHFVVTNLVVGHHYKLFARKEEAGYPEMSDGLYNPSGEAPTAIALSKDQALDMRVQLGPKAAILKWDVKDANTGASIQGVHFAIHRIDTGYGPEGSAPGQFSWLIPADTDLNVEFSAKGYKSWYHPGTGDKAMSTPLRKAPGAEVKLDILLQPDTK